MRPAFSVSDGKTVTLVDAVPAEDVLSINTPKQLAAVDRILRPVDLQGSPSASPVGVAAMSQADRDHIKIFRAAPAVP